MSSEKSISILISLHNYVDFIEQAIESALGQTYPKVEVVVVDNGSTDGSTDVVRSYGDKICAVIKEDGGQGSAINAGFAHARGDILMILDADDYLHPTAAERIAACWQPDIGVLHHRLRVVRNGSESNAYLPYKGFVMNSGDMLPYLLKHGGIYTTPPTSGWVFSREVLGAILPIPEKEFPLYVDKYFQVMTPFFSRLAVLDETLAYYRVHSANNYSGGVSRRFVKRAKVEEHLRFQKLGYQLAKKMADERHLAIAEESTLYRAGDLFEMLLLALSGPTSLNLISRLKMARATISRISVEDEYGVLTRIKETVLVIGVCCLPRSILRKIFPGVFST